ncbi:MAG: HEAT repeat domain-containing protein [Gemmatimonadales bacterium]
MDPTSTFIKRFGDLVALLRAEPSNDAAQDLALSAATRAVAESSLLVEGGAFPGRAEWPLKARMLARRVDCLRIAAGAEPHELLALARALAHDLTPIPCSEHVKVEQVRLLAPPPALPGQGHGPPGGEPWPPHGGGGSPNRRSEVERRQSEERRRSNRTQWRGLRRRQGGDRRISGERRLALIKDQLAEIAGLRHALDRAARAQAWDEVLLLASSLVRLAPRVPRSERGTFGIQVRQALSGHATEALVELAERDPSTRVRAREVLRWIGVDTVEVILARLSQGEALGVRVFYYDVVGGMPAAYPLVTPLLRSPALHEVRHGAALLGRLGRAEGVEVLRPLLGHPDELVRSAVVQALGELHEGAAADALRQALRHPSPRTRAVAAEAIAIWRGGTLALLLAAALEAERERDAWRAMIDALGRIGTAEACGALATVALTRRSILRRRGYTTGQRLAAVAALGRAENGHSRGMLERLVREDEGVVSYAADRVLQAEGLRAG